MFYIFGAFSLLWGLLWFLFARESPDKMTWINSDELTYIESKVVTVDQKSKKIPFKNICLSLPYWVSFNILTIFGQLFLGVKSRGQVVWPKAVHFKDRPLSPPLDRPF